MSAWEKIKVLQRLEGCAKCTSWKHGQGNCKHKRARQSKSKMEGKVGRKISKEFSGSNKQSCTGRSAHSIKQVTKKVTRQAAQQQNAGSRHKDRSQAEKEVSQNIRKIIIRTGDRVRRAKEGGLPGCTVTENPCLTSCHLKVGGHAMNMIRHSAKQEHRGHGLTRS